MAQTPKPAEKSAPPAQAQPAASTPTAPPKVRRTETIVDDNWTVTCAQTDAAQSRRICSATLRIAQPDKSGAQRVVFVWTIGRQDGKLVSAIWVPSGVQIPPGMEIKIGDKEARRLGYSICMPDHCESLLPLEDAVAKSLGGAQSTEITIRAAAGSDVKFTVNMKGFSQALADLGK